MVNRSTLTLARTIPQDHDPVNGDNNEFISNLGTKGARDPSIIRGRDNKTVWIIATVRVAKIEDILRLIFE